MEIYTVRPDTTEFKLGSRQNPEIVENFDILAIYQETLSNFDEQIRVAKEFHQHVVDNLDKYSDTDEGFFRASSDYYETLSATQSFELKKQEFLTNHDEKTGALNEKGFKKALRSHLEAAKESGQCVLVMVGDGDKFKDINDTYGHAAGDKVLQLFAKVGMDAVMKSSRTHYREYSGEYSNEQRAAKSNQPNDEIARLHGDEFAIVMTLPKDAAEIVVERIIERLKNVEAYHDGEKILSSMTLGSVAIIQSDPRTEITDKLIEKILEKADEDLYNNKPKKPNR